ncbi:MAG TPA: hypothetical protein VHF70_02580 [Rubrobacteraceae bacterium]|nr:hypothetical protein [Rubrobacteraceae bacterium]
MPDRGVKREGPRMHYMMSIELAKQRREELLREAEMNHQAKALRAARKGREGRKSELIWEIEKHAGGLLKRLRKIWREVGG